MMFPKWRKFVMVGSVGLILALLAAAWLPVAAQEGGPGRGVDRPVGAAAVAAQPQAETVVPPLGQPGLSFRYVQTFGETGVAYFEDTQPVSYTHLDVYKRQVSSLSFLCAD